MDEERTINPNIMSEQSEYWKDHRDSSKAGKLKKQKSDTELILLLCGEYDIDVETIAPHQLRLSGHGKRVDMFLQRESYQDLSTSLRGSYYKIGIEEFIETFFNL